jgi:division protein CdvB (Snf7/Vps24/ESCRT-III family)
MKLTSKELIKLVREELQVSKKDKEVIEEGPIADQLVALADQITMLLDKVEELVPNVFNAEKSAGSGDMTDDEIIDQERDYANEPPTMDESK